MRPEQDAYGQILRDIHTGRNPDAGEIIERDDGYIDYTGPANSYFNEYNSWLKQEQEGISHVDGRVLDIGCGAGRHSLYLQNEGYNVHAIDVSPGAVEVTSDRGVDNVSQHSFSEISSFASVYDTVILLGNNLALLGTKPIEGLNNLATVTSSDGKIIGQIREATNTMNPSHLHYHKFNQSRGRRPGCLRMRIRYKNYKTPYFDYLYIDIDKFKNLISETMWNIEKLYTDSENPQYTVVLGKDK